MSAQLENKNRRSGDVRPKNAPKPLITFEDDGEVDFDLAPRWPKRTGKLAGPMVVGGAPKASGQAIVRAGTKSDLKAERRRVNQKKNEARKKKRKVRPALVALGVAVMIVTFVFSLPKAKSDIDLGGPVVPVVVAPRAMVDVDSTGQPSILAGVMTPERGERPVEALVYLDLGGCATCLAPVKLLKQWYDQDSTRRALRVELIGQNAGVKKQMTDQGITEAPGVLLTGGGRTIKLSGTLALQNLFDSTKVLDPTPAPKP